MKNLLTFFSLVTLTFLTYAQPPKYDDLLVLYADANYEKLAKVASDYTENDKTNKDILPYIWCAKGLYKIHLSNSADEAFKNAYKDALKYAAKGLKYDLKYNNGATFEEHREFLDELQLSLQEIIENELIAGGFRKAYGWAIRYNKITTNPAGNTLLMGACKFEEMDKTTARSLWQEADAQLAEITSVENWSEGDLKMLKTGALYSAASMKKGRQIDQARELLNKVSQWFEEDDDWKNKCDEIVN